MWRFNLLSLLYLEGNEIQVWSPALRAVCTEGLSKYLGISETASRIGIKPATVERLLLGHCGDVL